MNEKYSCDVLVIGGGIAACFAAIKAAEAGASVVMADKGYVGRSGQSPYADSFMVYNPDWGHDLKESVSRITKVGEYVNNTYWTEKCLLDSFARFEDLRSWGCKFETKEDGTLRTGKQDGNCQVAVMFDKKAGSYGEVLRRVVKKSGVIILDHVMITEFLKNENRISGAIGLTQDTDKPITILAKTTVSCAGGCGYKPVGYPPLMQLTGDIEALAYKAGAAITGKEFVDTHFSPEGMADPTGQRDAPLPPPPPKEGEMPKKPKGGMFDRYNCDGELISERPEGTASYAFTYLQSEFEIHKGKGPITIKGKESVGGSCLGMSLRKADGLYPADKECRSTVAGLFAAGDGLGTMQNGATYDTQGASICNSAVTGTIAGEAAAKEAAGMKEIKVKEDEIKRALEFTLSPLKRNGGFTPAWATSLLQNIMAPYFITFIKKEDRLNAALTYVLFLKEHIVPNLYAKDIHELRLCHETANMVLSAEMRLRSGLFRTESRGNHYREDYPFRDDKNWLSYTKIFSDNGKMTLEKVMIPEEERLDKEMSYKERYSFRLLDEKIPEEM
ncbi:MAG: FAD-binding protein [Eubacterium sp.]|nr:FAD-binding protein [Eubacterium sp.]